MLNVYVDEYDVRNILTHGYGTLRLSEKEAFNTKEFDFRISNQIVVKGLCFNSLNSPVRLECTSDIIIENCNFTNSFFIEGRCSSLSLKNVTIKESVIIKLQSNFLSLTEIKESNDISIESDIKQSLTVVDCQKLNLSILGSYRGDCFFKKISGEIKCSGSFGKKVSVLNSKINTLSFEKCDFHGPVEIIETCNISCILFTGSRFKSTFTVSNSSIESGNLDMQIFTSKVAFQENTLIKKLDLKLTGFESELSFIGNTFEMLSIEGKILPLASVLILKNSVSDLRFNQLLNQGSLTLELLHDIKNITILKSNFGLAEMHKVDFSSAFCYFEKSKINEVFMSETDFPENVYNSEKLLDFGQGKLMHGQLQTLFNKQGDSVRASEYLSREVRCYYHIINWRKDFFHKINLGLNSLSNNFGRSWSRGVLFTFACAFFWFSSIILSTDEFSLGIPNMEIFNLTGPFLKFVNPLRHFETEALFTSTLSPHLTLNNWSYIWDFLGRLFVAYGIYQTIQAFRKFGRR